MALVLVQLAVALSIGMAAIGTGIALRNNRRRRSGITIERTANPLLEQYEARTPAGPVVITKVIDDRGPAYEIETSLRGEPTRRHYVVPSMARVRYILDTRVSAYLTEREANR